jgi:hypothetical protein
MLLRLLASELDQPATPTPSADTAPERDRALGVIEVIPTLPRIG